MNDFDLKKRTKKFAHDCVKIATMLPETKLGLHLQGQLIRCSTSVAANYRAACIAQSIRAFIAKISIVIEEVDESNYWIEFIIDENLMENQETNFEYLFKESAELTSIFISSRKTAQMNILQEDDELYITNKNTHEK